MRGRIGPAPVILKRRNFLTRQFNRGLARLDGLDGLNGLARLDGLDGLGGLHLRLTMIMTGLSMAMIRLAWLHLRLTMVIVAGAAWLYVALIRSAGLHLRLTRLMVAGLSMAMIRLAGLNLRFTGLSLGLGMVMVTGLSGLNMVRFAKLRLRATMMRPLCQGNRSRGQNCDGCKNVFHSFVLSLYKRTSMDFLFTRR